MNKVYTVGRIIFEDKKFRGFRGYFLNLENIYPRNVLLSSNYYYYPQKFIHKNFSMKQISDDPQNFISSKINRPKLYPTYNYQLVSSKLYMYSAVYVFMFLNMQTVLKGCIDID